MHTPRVPGTTLLLAAAGWLAAQPASGDVTPHRLFSDHAVLQRDVMLPVWGTASDGEKVTVEFAGQKVETVARDGRFRVDLAPLAASAAGRTLTFTGRNTVTVRDVLVGEVWLCSGQSNMEASMGWLHTFSPDRAAALAAVADPLVLCGSRACRCGTWTSRRPTWIFTGSRATPRAWSLFPPWPRSRGCSTTQRATTEPARPVSTTA